MTIRTLADITFATARIGYNGGAGPLTSMDLKLDAYLPAATTRSPRPAVVLAFGGAFHRGSKENDSFSDGLGTSTAVSDYCRLLALDGIPAFSVQYRLAQVESQPPVRTVLTQPDDIPMSRINPVRVEMGLPAVSPRAMANVMEAAFEDVARAVDFIRDNAETYGVDPARMVLGGFSAGGRCAMYAAYGRGVDVAGVIALSGPLVPADARAYLARGGTIPPLLMVSGERDLDYVCTFVPELEAQFRGAGAQVEWAMIPSGTHFYAHTSEAKDGRRVTDIMRAALERWVGPLPERVPGADAGFTRIAPFSAPGETKR